MCKLKKQNEKASALCVLVLCSESGCRYTVEWIMCETCENWFHETCTDTVNDLYFTCSNYCKKQL